MDFDVVHSARNYYELLGLSSSADDKELRHAFRSLSKILHPDTTSLPAEEAASRFQQVCEAYELLSDPIQRKAYDDSLAAGKKIYMTPFEEPVKAGKNYTKNNKALEVRRAFSGGELFSLLLMAVAFLISSLQAIIFALSQGREMQVRPSWLNVVSSSDQVQFQTDMKTSSNFLKIYGFIY